MKSNFMTLYIVGTPIGNLQDTSPRVIDTLKGVGLVLCEDTRVTGKLLSHFEIKVPTESFHQHSDRTKLKKVLDQLETKNLALVTDAGTPGISDPGGILVEEAVKKFGDEIKIVPIPGPSAITTALSVSGFPADEFTFLGFPPHKKGRKKYFDRLAGIDSTVVFYESTHRIIKTLGELEARIGERQILLGRELTKLHETLYRGTVNEVTNKLNSDSLKGEFVIVISPV